jgi:hypothetical protein
VYRAIGHQNLVNECNGDVTPTDAVTTGSLLAFIDVVEGENGETATP